MYGLIFLFLFVVVPVLYGIAVYNRLTKLKFQVEEGWSDIDVQLRRRYNLIPNLVETVKGYASHERETFEEVVQARNAAMANDGPPEDQAKTENMLTGALRHLFALAENYPDLKANQNFLSLQKDLYEVEDKIQSARRYYNGTVRDNNTYVHQFPSNIVARLFDFHTADFFEIEDDAVRAPVAVKF
jgi:LemA protein